MGKSVTLDNNLTLRDTSALKTHETKELGEILLVQNDLTFTTPKNNLPRKLVHLQCRERSFEPRHKTTTCLLGYKASVLKFLDLANIGIIKSGVILYRQRTKGLCRCAG